MVGGGFRGGGVVGVMGFRMRWWLKRKWLGNGRSGRWIDVGKDGGLGRWLVWEIVGGLSWGRGYRK